MRTPMNESEATRYFTHQRSALDVTADIIIRRGWRLAADWSGKPTGGGGGDGPSSGGIGRPTETAALTPDWTANALRELKRLMADVDHVIAQLEAHARLIVGHGEQVDELGDENSRTGDCSACGRWCNGQRTDRLVIVPRERGNDRRYCPACFTAWRRNLDTDHPVDAGEFERMRSAGVERTEENVA
jgi:hypothetical protein